MITINGTAAHVERTVPPVYTGIDPVLQWAGTGTLERTADRLGRAVYEAASLQATAPQRILVRLTVSCPYVGDLGAREDLPARYVVRDTNYTRRQGATSFDIDFVARDTIRNLSRVRAHGSPSAYAASSHWRSISRPQLST